MSSLFDVLLSYKIEIAVFSRIMSNNAEHAADEKTKFRCSFTRNFISSAEPSFAVLYYEVNRKTGNRN